MSVTDITRASLPLAQRWRNHPYTVATLSVMLLRLASILYNRCRQNIIVSLFFVEVIAYCFYVFLCGVKPTMNVLIFLSVKILLQK